MKKILKHEKVQRALARLFTAYSRFTFRFTRWTRIDDDMLTRRAAEGRPFIVCFWHNRMAIMVNFWQFPMPLYLLGSVHRDARLVADALAPFGVRSIIGSSSQRGMRAMREMARAIRTGGSVCITPDGPRGPRMRATLGPIALAKITGVPIFPVTLSTTRGRVLDSWDRLLLVYPFGRGVFIAGEPIEVPSDADETALEAARLTLEQRLTEITAEADRRCGRPPIEPAPQGTA